MLKIFTTARVKQKIFYNDYGYKIIITKSSKIYLRWVESNFKGMAMSSDILNSKTILFPGKTHNHGPKVNRKIAMMIKNNIRENALESIFIHPSL